MALLILVILVALILMIGGWNHGNTSTFHLDCEAERHAHLEEDYDF